MSSVDYCGGELPRQHGSYGAREGVHGRDVTPYLLAQFHRETGGASLEANVRLVRRNAALAARIAAADAVGRA